MKPFHFPALACCAASLIAVALGVPGVLTEEMPIGFLPNEWVKQALQKHLSPQGRTSMVTATGPVRVTDAEERVAAIRNALANMQRAPALVPVELNFATTTERVVQRLPVEPPVIDRGIPVPNRYDPPRIIAGPGGVTVVPSQPRDFTTRNVGPGTVVNPSPTGYQTLTPEVRMSETVVTGGITRRFSASTVLGKAVALAAVPRIPDVEALRTLARKYGAIGDSEPAWTAAGTELLVRPELSGGALVVNITPQIVLAPSATGQAARRLPLTACAAGVLIARGAPGSSGLLPKTDPEFYRVFLGIAQALDDSITALTVKADVQYLGSPPQ